MIRTSMMLVVLACCVLAHSNGERPTSVSAGQPKQRKDAEQIAERFTVEFKPFVERYCITCHGPKKKEAMLDLSKELSVVAIAKNERHWQLVLNRLQANEMPPDDAARQPKEAERVAAIKWLRDYRNFEAERNAGDPGIVLARRLSNAEFDNTIRDLTGYDLRPTREFPVDPANEAGFDNSGESLAMSPALLKKYLSAARSIADHVVLKPDGFVFAPHPMVTETDRDKYCVQRIVDFYKRHEVDLADYFLAAWKHRRQPKTELKQLASEAGLSANYLALVWSALTEAADQSGPLAEIRNSWNALPDSAESIRPACERLRDQLIKLRAPLKPAPAKISVNGISAGSQPFVLWNNRQLAIRHRSYAPKANDAQMRPTERAALERFCSVFPDAFAVVDRGPYFSPNQADKGRPLTAGFHLMHGHYRDDEPLCELILSDKERREIDSLWDELNFITLAPMRQYKDFIFFERAEPPRFMFEAEFDFARSEDKDAGSEAKMTKLQQLYLAKARRRGAKLDAVDAIESYFTVMSFEIRKVERARLAAESSHLDALLKFAERAYRRPLIQAERADLLAFYRKLRDRDGLDHEEALRDTLASVLLSPGFLYRVSPSAPTNATATIHPLTDYELASRLSYFLWSSMPDDELLARAAAGDLHKPDVLKAQTRRMLRDPKVRGLATEFAGNWLDFRRFEEHNAVDRQRFPAFTNELRQAMFEEPVRYCIDLAQRDRSVLDLLNGGDTFVNATLAKHYGMPQPKGSNEWQHVEDAQRYGRGGMLTMAVFQTKNAPGLRTSPVKRGYWVVRRLLGEEIPPPPPTVPELPQDEAKLELPLPKLLAKHRDNKACAGCHQRFDSVGLVFEGFGPIGERRSKDLGNKPVEMKATFPDGKEREGIAGLRDYLNEKRHDDFIDNLCRKLLSYALSRGLMLSDTKTIEAMKQRLKEDNYRFGGLVETIVESAQFLNRREKRE